MRNEHLLDLIVHGQNAVGAMPKRETCKMVVLRDEHQVNDVALDLKDVDITVLSEAQEDQLDLIEHGLNDVDVDVIPKREAARTFSECDKVLSPRLSHRQYALEMLYYPSCRHWKGAGRSGSTMGWASWMEQQS